MDTALIATAQLVTAQLVTRYQPFAAAEQLPIAVPFHPQGINEEIASLVADLLGTDAENVAIHANSERGTVYVKDDNRRSEQHATQAGLAAYHALTNTREGKHPAFYGPCVIVEPAPAPATELVAPLAEAPTVLARLAFKDPDFQIERLAGSKAQLAALLTAYVEYEEYLVVEFLSDGSTRVVPVRE